MIQKSMATIDTVVWVGDHFNHSVGRSPSYSNTWPSLIYTIIYNHDNHMQKIACFGAKQ